MLEPCASCVMSSQPVSMFHYASCAPSNMLAVHGHGRDTLLSTCLVYVACVVAFVACVNGDEFSVMYLILLHQLCIGMDEASALVCALCLSRVHHLS